MSLRDGIHSRNRLHVRGIVQGVGFRPFVYRLASEYELMGFVINGPDGVEIEVQGVAESLNMFYERLRADAPPRARIDELIKKSIPLKSETEFTIDLSRSRASATALISPDIATCADCLTELNDSDDRRYRYPFINSTNCGPRFTILKRIPYDRPSTSMAPFIMCKHCQSEYDDPLNRRFHAEPNGCTDCGPKIWFEDNDGTISSDPIESAVTILRNGGLLALRGLGGYHLVVDATNETAIALLRERKGRGNKPFALMTNSLGFIEKCCLLSDDERQLLSGPTRPIVLLQSKQSNLIAESVAPNQDLLGFMLPYTPLHHLLMEQFKVLVMTSGNLAEEPIAIGNDEALVRLSRLADGFLMHDREILQRCDDSVMRVQCEHPRLIRRARGFAPDPIKVEREILTTVLALGGELKNTIAVGRGHNVFLSQYIGNLDNPTAYDFFKHNIDHLPGILQTSPEYIVCDSHPDYLSSRYAHLEQSLPVVQVQHHHAHLASVMAENGRSERTIGLILDGTGYGLDGSIWGSEILIGDFGSFERFSFFQPVRMPGGEICISEPYRMALSWLHTACPDKIKSLPLPLWDKIGKNRIEAVLEMLSKNINCPLTSSCGRLFDAVAVLLGINEKVTYEAEAAIQLEILAKSGNGQAYQIESTTRIGKPFNLIPLLNAIVKDIERGRPREDIAASFHITLANYLVAAATDAREYSGCNVVALSGGVWQNDLLLNLVMDRLASEKFEVITHRTVPTNDGGLSLGQVMIANEQWTNRKL